MKGMLSQAGLNAEERAGMPAVQEQGSRCGSRIGDAAVLVAEERAGMPAVQEQGSRSVQGPGWAPKL